MPHLQTAGQIKIPFGGRSPRARQASLKGAQVAVVRCGSQSAWMLIAYLELGPRSDLQMAETLGLPEARISARRNGLIDRKLVQYADTITGPFGADNCRWALTNYGREVAKELARAQVEM